MEKRERSPKFYTVFGVLLSALIVSTLYMYDNKILIFDTTNKNIIEATRNEYRYSITEYDIKTLKVIQESEYIKTAWVEITHTQSNKSWRKLLWFDPSFKEWKVHPRQIKDDFNEIKSVLSDIIETAR